MTRHHTGGWVLPTLLLLLWTTLAWSAPLTLTWDAPTSGDAPTAYTMYRKVGTGSFVAIGTTDAPGVTFTDAAPAIGTNTYRVTATNPGGESLPSNEVTFRVYQVPGPPTNLRVP